MGLKIVFAGTPEFAIPALQALYEEHDICAVYTKPDSPSGRGLKLCYSPVKKYVLDNFPNLPVLQPVNLKDENTQRQLGEFFADVMVVIAYGLMIPAPVFTLFKYGCINVHASLLPRWRGAAPIQRALLAGDHKTGVTIMQIDEGLDTGKMLEKAEYSVEPSDSAKIVHDKLAKLGATTLLETLKKIVTDQLKPEIQNHQLATYAAKISKDEALINWHESAVHIDRQIRAFNPWPVAYTYLQNELLKIWECQIIQADSSRYLAGRIMSASEKGIDVATKLGVIRLLKVQVAGGKPMSAKEFLNSRRNLIIPNETILGGRNVGHT